MNPDKTKCSHSSNPEDYSDPWTGAPESYFPHFLARNSARRCSIVLARRKNYSWRCPPAVLQRWCWAGGGWWGRRVRDRDLKGYILQTRRVHALERNLCLGWGWGCDLIQKISWQPILLRVSPRPDSSWHVSFLPPQLSAARPHHYCSLICLFIYLFLTLCFLFHASHPLTLAVWIPGF